MAAVIWIRYLAALVCLWVFSVVPVCDVESEVGVEPVLVVGVDGGGGRLTFAGPAKLKPKKTIDAIATIAASTISTMLVSRRCRPRGREFDLG